MNRNLVARLDGIRAQVRAEAVRVGRPELAELLDDADPGESTTAVRIVVAGETKRGKSSLVNSLAGRPLLSPVGVDVTTACWVELSYGEQDEATGLLADPTSLCTPLSVPIWVPELGPYV